jgi:hypothetical protein
VIASGTEPLTYQWHRGTTPLADGGNISGASTATLTIDPAGSADAGTDYNVVVTNDCGSATSDLASLSVTTVALPGDMNCDNIVDMNDIPLFIPALLNEGPVGGCDINRADVNGDSQIDGLDMQPFVNLLVNSPSPVLACADLTHCQLPDFLCRIVIPSSRSRPAGVQEVSPRSMGAGR